MVFKPMKDQWGDKKFDGFLKTWYNSKVKVDPAMLVLGLRDLGMQLGGGLNGIRSVVKRLQHLGLKK